MLSRDFTADTKAVLRKILDQAFPTGPDLF